MGLFNKLTMFASKGSLITLQIPPKVSHMRLPAAEPLQGLLSNRITGRALIPVNGTLQTCVGMFPEAAGTVVMCVRAIGDLLELNPSSTLSCTIRTAHWGATASLSAGKTNDPPMLR